MKKRIDISRRDFLAVVTAIRAQKGDVTLRFNRENHQGHVFTLEVGSEARPGEVTLNTLGWSATSEIDLGDGA